MAAASVAAGVALVSGIVGCTPAAEPDERGAGASAPSVAVAPTELVGLDDPLFPRQGNPGYDARDYHWRLTVDPGANTLSAAVVMTAVALERREWIALDYGGPRPRTVEVDDRPAPFVRMDDKLVIAATLDAGDDFDVAVSYAGTPTAGTVDGVAFPVGWIHRPDLVFTNSLVPGAASSWIPVNDSPRDPATYTIRITAPPGYAATASGQRIGSAPDDGTTEWRVDVPVSEVAIAVGRFDHHAARGPDGLPIDLTLPADGSVPVDWFEPLPDMVAFLTERFGPFPFPQLGITWINDLGAGGDATPARILLASAREEVLVHEVAHQWMGGVVGTASTRDVWVREGVPTYAEALWAEHVDGVEARDRMMASWRRRLGPTTRPPLEIDDVQDRSDDVTFLRSALALHAVRERLGDAAFFRALQMFFDRYAGTSATTEDVIKTFEEAAGEPLDALFRAWLEQEAVPDG